MDDLEKVVVEELEDVKTLYFTVNMLTQLQRTRLVIPSAFTRKTGWPGHEHCELLTSDSSTSKWPVQFEITSGEIRGTRLASSVGHGWSTFLVDLEVKQGSLLLFEVEDSRSLVVTLYHPDSPRKRLPAKEETEPLRRQSDGPVFKKTLRASHVRPGPTARLDLPTSYWRTVGEEHFKNKWFILTGPRAAVCVKSQVYVTAKQTFCVLNKGWTEFVALNDFKLHDTLLFAAVGKLEFNVDCSSL